jgi:hypothetical protein
MLIGGQWLEDVIKATRNSRSVALGGCFPKYFKVDKSDESDEDMIHTGLSNSDETEQNTIDIPFGFNERIQKYKVIK